MRAAPISFTLWSIPMRKFLAVCRRLDDYWSLDLIGVVLLFAIIPVMLMIGGAE